MFISRKPSININTWTFTIHDGGVWGVRDVFRSVLSTHPNHWSSQQRVTQIASHEMMGNEAYGFANPISDIAHDSGAPLYEPIKVEVL